MILILASAQDISEVLDSVEPETLEVLDEIGVVVVATAKEVIDSVVTQLNKALAELTEKIANGTVTAEDLAGLQEVAQKLDDVVPDVPEEPVNTEPLPTEPEVPADEPTSENPDVENPGQL